MAIANGSAGQSEEQELQLESEPEPEPGAKARRSGWQKLNGARKLHGQCEV